MHYLTTWIVVKEQDWSSEHRGKHSVVEDAGGIDTDEVEKSPSKEVEEDEHTIHPGIDSNPVGLTEGASERLRAVSQ